MQYCEGKAPALKVREDKQNCWRGVYVNTFDLGVCMKVFHLVWKHPYQYSKHIIFPFTPKYDSTEILMEAELVTSGTLLSILSRKAYWKSLFLLKAVGQALERLLFETLPNKI